MPQSDAISDQRPNMAVFHCSIVSCRVIVRSSESNYGELSEIVRRIVEFLLLMINLTNEFGISENDNIRFSRSVFHLIATM